MQQKLILINEYQRVIVADSMWSFATISPVKAISSPTTTLFYAWAGNLSMVSLSSIPAGTLIRCRSDFNDPLPLNFDQWTFNSTGTVNLLEIREVNKRKILYHWTNRIPLALQNDAPIWVSNLIDEKLKNFNKPNFNFLRDI